VIGVGVLPVTFEAVNLVGEASRQKVVVGGVTSPP
jgi:hypothetical protein